MVREALEAMKCIGEQETHEKTERLMQKTVNYQTKKVKLEQKNRSAYGFDGEQPCYDRVTSAKEGQVTDLIN